jgi:hypothetical protein
MMDYDTDFYQWTAETANLLRERRFAELDLDAVVEEIEAMGRQQKHEVYSRVLRILEHRIKLDMITGVLLEHNRRGWLGSVERQRAELAELFEISPSLRRLVDVELIAQTYCDAARIVALAFDLQPDPLCPYSVSDVLGE